METKYDAELELQLGSGRRSSSANSDTTRSTRVADWFGNATNPRNQQQQQITIFYKGKICVSDVTEIQARAIICMARKAMEERLSIEEKLNNQGIDKDLSPKTPASPQLIHPGLSMKRSLQRFLQKRKARMEDASPYGCRPSY